MGLYSTRAAASYRGSNDSVVAERPTAHVVRAGLARLWDTPKSHIVFEEKFAGVQGFRFEARAIGGDKPPMSDFAAQQVDETK